MCYIGNLNDESSVAKMATEDIKVYKEMDRCGEIGNFSIIKSAIRHFNYPLKRLQRSGCLDVRLMDILTRTGSRPSIIVEEGLHSIISVEKLWDYWNTDVITECYIPKGSIYFTNGTECVSQELIFDRSYKKESYLRYHLASKFQRFFSRKPKPIYVWKD